MKISIQLILALSLLFLFSNCKKGDITLNECEEIPLQEGGTFSGWSWKKVYPYYEFPSFNPNNPQEIVFRAQLTSSDTAFRLMKYNLITKESEVVIQEDFGIRPKWGRNDWILLRLKDHQIYKVKSNGDSLTQLTTQGRCLGPEWNKTADKFIYELVVSEGTVSIICDQFGNPLDTLVGGSISPSWQHDSLLTNLSPAWLFVQNVNSPELDFEVIQEIGDTGTTTAEWIDDENIIWAYNEGIFVSNIITKKTTRIKESCDSKVYKYPTVSFEGQKVIFQRTDKTVTGHYKGTATSRFFIMNFDGTDEQEIVFW